MDLQPAEMPPLLYPHNGRVPVYVVLGGRVHNLKLTGGDHMQSV